MNEIEKRLKETEKIKEQIKVLERELLEHCPASRYVWADGKPCLDKWRFNLQLEGHQV